MLRIIAICNQKGGVGKTTTAINLSAFLALSKKQVLLIDLDPQGNTTSGMGIDKTAVAKTSYHILLTPEEINSSILSTWVENLFLLPSNTDLIGAEVELVNEIDREFKLKNALEKLSSDFDFILIDTPPSLGLLTLNALCSANSVLIPMQCEYYALEGLGELMTTIQMVQKSINKSLQIEGLILTMADFRTNLTQEVIKEVREFLPDKVYETIIPRSVKLSEAPSFGKPIWFHDKHSTGAIKYKELSAEFLRRQEILQDQKKQPFSVEQESVSLPVLTLESQKPEPESKGENLPVSQETNQIFIIPPEGVI